MIVSNLILFVNARIGESGFQQHRSGISFTYLEERTALMRGTLFIRGIYGLCPSSWDR